MYSLAPPIADDDPIDQGHEQIVHPLRLGPSSNVTWIVPRMPPKNSTSPCWPVGGMVRAITRPLSARPETMVVA